MRDGNYQDAWAHHEDHKVEEGGFLEAPSVVMTEGSANWQGRGILFPVAYFFAYFASVGVQEIS